MPFHHRRAQSAPTILGAYNAENDNMTAFELLSIQEAAERQERAGIKFEAQDALKATSAPKDSQVMTIMKAQLGWWKPGAVARDFKCSATDQALNVNELLVHILNFLPYADLLLEQRVSKKFQHVITSTACLQRALFKQPMTEAVIAQEASGVLSHQRFILSDSSTWNSAGISPTRPAILKISNLEATLFHPFMVNLWGTGVSKYLDVGSCDPGMNIKSGCIKARVSIPSVNELYAILYKPRVVPNSIAKDYAFQPAFKHLAMAWRIGPEEWVAYEGSRHGVVFSDMVRCCECDGNYIPANGMNLESFVNSIKTTFLMAVGRAESLYDHDAVMALSGLLVMHFHC